MKRDDLHGLRLSNPIHFVAVGFGSGLASKAPGTFGTLAAVPFYYLMSFLSLDIYIVILVASSLLGFWLCHITSRDMGVHDHKSIVWDEFVGYWITMVMVPFSIKWAIVGFVLFRFFDIIKPYPISWLDKKVGGGLGIMIDDIVAGLFSAIVLQFLIHLYG
ncbi:phosphatidylglycerophosphatase A [Psychromonas antarctica]|uniref:phosphatidylglycerophosphatase A family protein n=1 Tax=Psychromonas antarctica TaxID=67573 RepID=UPI001EE90BE8|nr:phosphatidylglycerophosphatase A [Psychromonas antarctica]MCG6200458.1 phosphatidylglycerophosphatase A [Psychromonas antarctica]